MNASKGLGTGCASSTRGLLAGGRTPTSWHLNIIDFITISTLGNAADFGDLTSTKFGLAAGSNSIRGLFAGGKIQVNLILLTMFQSQPLEMQLTLEI